MLFSTYVFNDHPYKRSFAEALAPSGIEFEPANTYSDRDLAAQHNRIQGIHLHWVEYLWKADTAWQRLRHIVGFTRFCAYAKHLGLRIIWTVHNHAAHDNHRWLDHFGYKAVAKAADLIIVHSRWSKAYVESKYHPRGKMVVMPHGNFDDAYFPEKSPAVVRDKLRLRTDLPVCGMIGTIKPYRGHELAIEAAKRLGPKVQLLIAGPANDVDFVNRLKTAGLELPNVRIVIGDLTDNEYAEMVQACDIILLPYRQITGSGALLSAWTLGRPVVMSDLPFFREFQPKVEAAGVIMEARTGAAIAKSIERLLLNAQGEREMAARQEAEKYAWEEVVRPVGTIIQSWRKQPSTTDVATVRR